jgi:hypothetical protein
MPLLLDGTLTANAVKAITGVTNANPAVYSVSAIGTWATGDIVLVRGVLGNTSVNQVGIITVTGNTWTMTTPDGVAIQGNGAYTAGGCAVNLSKIATLADINGCKSGSTTDPTCANPTITGDGIIDADDPAAWTNFTGTIHAMILYVGAAGTTTAPVVVIQDGRTQIRCAATAASSATSIAVNPLEGPIASGSTLVFSNGITATTTADAAAGATTISVSALAGSIAVGCTAEGVVTGSALPVTLSSGQYTHQFSNSTNKIAKC